MQSSFSLSSVLSFLSRWHCHESAGCSKAKGTFVITPEAKCYLGPFLDQAMGLCVRNMTYYSKVCRSGQCAVCASWRHWDLIDLIKMKAIDSVMNLQQQISIFQMAELHFSWDVNGECTHAHTHTNKSSCQRALCRKCLPNSEIRVCKLCVRPCKHTFGWYSHLGKEVALQISESTAFKLLLPHIKCVNDWLVTNCSRVYLWYVTKMKTPLVLCERSWESIDHLLCWLILSLWVSVKINAPIQTFQPGTHS